MKLSGCQFRKLPRRQCMSHLCAIYRVWDIRNLNYLFYWRRHGALKWWHFRDEWKQRAWADSTVDHHFYGKWRNFLSRFRLLSLYQYHWTHDSQVSEGGKPSWSVGSWQCEVIWTRDSKTITLGQKFQKSLYIRFLYYNIYSSRKHKKNDQKNCFEFCLACNTYIHVYVHWWLFTVTIILVQSGQMNLLF